MCITYDSATYTQGQGHTSKSCGLRFNSCRSISPRPFDRFSLNFTQKFLLLRQCAEHMTKLSRLKVTGQGQGFTLNFLSILYILNPLSDFH